MGVDFTIATEHFEGPLEALLHLIEKRKLLINDISLSRVADDFVAYIQQHEEQNSLEDTSQFLIVASTLLLIKSRSLLPTLVLTKQETHDIQELETRLHILQKIKQAIPEIEANYKKRTLYSPQERTKKEMVSWNPSTNTTIEVIEKTVHDLVEALPKQDQLPQAVVAKVQSLEDTMTLLSKRVTQNIEMSFNAFSERASKDKMHVVVSFLALLELVKQGSIIVSQQESFADIGIETKEIATPHYS